MRRLSKPIGDLRIHYDVVVVGSGYGGGVAASRMARSGFSVCLLERGKEYSIGDFPDRISEANSEFQITRGNSHFGSKLGLYDLRINDDINVFVGCGLGGTSLINANVSLPPDERVWEDQVWPEELMDEDTDRDEGFARAERMLNPVPYPNKTNLDKLRALRISGAALNKECVTPPINVTFEKQVNRAGVMQPACTLCGDCCSGCNVGSKNTTQMNYLPDAVNHGAEIFTECSVNSIRKERGKWRVFFELVGREREKFGAPEQSISADIVILSAGTLGSTEILLRSQEQNGLKLSEQLGNRFTGNGDVLAFAYNNDVPINGIGFGHPPRVDIPPVGPCISGLIDLRGTDRLEDGMVIEEGSIPSSLAPLLPPLFSTGNIVFGEDTDFSISDEASEAKRALQSWFLGAYKGAVNHTQTFLVMSHDDGNGQMRLDGGTLKVNWPGVTNQEVFTRVEQNLRIAAEANGGTYIENPISKTAFGENMITVHPLGGCAIGRNRDTGVVNHKCQVFDGEQIEAADAVHEGLYVCDGSIIPRPLGVNPLLTITALSERAMIHLARDYSLDFDDKPKVDAPTRLSGILQPRVVMPAGVEFTERMAGFISGQEAKDFDAAALHGKREGNNLSFTVTVIIDDVDAFADDPERTGKLIGSVICPAISPDPLDISAGTFNLMRQDEDAVETRRFDYRMTLSATDGKIYQLHGYKIVRADAGLDLWDDTTKLYVELYGGQHRQHGLLAQGVLNIAISDFANQLRTIKGTNGKDAADRINAVAKFGELFASSLYKVYGGVFVRTDRYDPNAVRKKRELKTGAPEIHLFNTEDGKTLRLTRYNGGEKGPVIFSHGLGVSSKIFSIDTIDTNLLEFVHAAGFDCWLLDYRASTDLSYCRELWTADDVARFDYQIAVDTVRQITGKNSVQMVAHCFGSTTFFMAMLSGLQGVRSAVSSQIATDVIVPWFPQRMLAYLRLPSLFSMIGIDNVNARAESYDRLWERVMDKLIQVLVPFQWEERTRNATSNRITALYGQLYELDQLNAATMQSGLPEMFGAANIDAFKHLARIAREQKIVTSEGEDLYLPNIAQLAIPICFIHGAENACFVPESTELTMERLASANGPDLYERHLIPDYGHIDCIFGKDAVIDVYPHILRHLEKHAAG